MVKNLLWYIYGILVSVYQETQGPSMLRKKIYNVLKTEPYTL